MLIRCEFEMRVDYRKMVNNKKQNKNIADSIICTRLMHRLTAHILASLFEVSITTQQELKEISCYSNIMLKYILMLHMIYRNRPAPEAR